MGVRVAEWWACCRRLIRVCPWECADFTGPRVCSAPGFLFVHSLFSFSHCLFPGLLKTALQLQLIGLGCPTQTMVTYVLGPLKIPLQFSCQNSDQDWSAPGSHVFRPHLSKTTENLSKPRHFMLWWHMEGNIWKHSITQHWQVTRTPFSLCALSYVEMYLDVLTKLTTPVNPQTTTKPNNQIKQLPQGQRVTCEGI